MKPRLQRAFSRLLELLELLIRPGSVVTVYGDPAHEGNGVEVVRSLSHRYPGRIHWLYDKRREVRPDRLPANVRALPHLSARAVGGYLRSEVVFFTHGLYGPTRPRGRHVFVNLWHGDGIKVKRIPADAPRSAMPSTYASGATLLLTRKRAQDFKVPDEACLVFGNPRIDAFSDPVPPSLLAALGLLEDEPFAVWLPTFRVSRRSTGEARDFDEGASVNISMQEVIGRLSRAGIRVVVKPHPQETTSRAVPGAAILTEELLVRSGTSLYPLLGASRGLITDYSSVWTDYLTLDRPIGFVITDAATYVRQGGIYPPDILDWLPGENLESDDAVERFADEVLGGGSRTGAGLRRRCADHIGLARTVSATDDLLDALDERRAFSAAGGLRPRPARREQLPAIGLAWRPPAPAAAPLTARAAGVRAEASRHE